MEKETAQKIKLGFFVITGLVILVLAFYFIGRNQNFFGKTFTIVTLFGNVNGLQTGNNVRFAGTDVGSVSSVEITSDTSVKVILKIDEKFRSFIKRDALANVGTDGLMGNKLINILNLPRTKAGIIVSGDTIESVAPVETDEMLRTLNRTNEYVSTIALNLKNLTDQFGSSRGTIWKLLTDKKLSLHLDSIMINMHQTTNQIYSLSQNLNSMIKKIRQGNGMIGTILNDTIFYENLQKTMADLKLTTERTARVSGDLDKMMNGVSAGKGTLGVLLKDSAMSSDFKESIRNIKMGVDLFNQNMEALKQSDLLKGYFKKLEKERSEKLKK